MKRILTVFLALMLAGSLAACAKTPASSAAAPASGTASASGAAPAPSEAPVSAAPAPQENKGTWVYDVKTAVWEDEERLDDGTLLAHARYEYPVLFAKGSAIDPPPAGAEAPQQMLDRCDAFNAHFDAGDFAQTMERLAEAGRSYYEECKTTGNPYIPFEEFTGVSSVYQTPDFVSVAGFDDVLAGPAHEADMPNAVNFDLAAGEFVELGDLTDEPEFLLERLGDRVRRQIREQGTPEEYRQEMLEVPGFVAQSEATFDEYGVHLRFYPGMIALFGGGMQSFTVEYEEWAALLNERGRRLLALPEERQAFADFCEAQELWDYFNMTTMPCNTEGTFTGPNGEPYNAVDYRGLQSLDALRDLLLRRFSDAIVYEELLPPPTHLHLHYTEIDGMLCAMQAGRGARIDRGEATYEVRLSEGGGAVIATVEELDPGAAPAPGQETTEYGFPIVGHTEIEFPFEWTESGARFTAFESIW